MSDQPTVLSMRSVSCDRAAWQERYAVQSHGCRLMQSPFWIALQAYILGHEVLCHWTPYLRAIHAGDVPVPCQVLRFQEC